MTKSAKTIPSDLPPDGQTRWSTILNGASNGLMIAGGAFVIPELGYKLATQKPVSTTYEILAVTGAAIGCVIGGALGARDATTHEQYRASLAEKFHGLQQQVQSDQAKIAELYARVQAHASEKTVASSR